MLLDSTVGAGSRAAQCRPSANRLLSRLWIIGLDGSFANADIARRTYSAACRRQRENRASFTAVPVRRAPDHQAPRQSFARNNDELKQCSHFKTALREQDIEAIIVVIAIVTAIFWRVLLKIPLMIALLLFIILMATSAVAITDVYCT